MTITTYTQFQQGSDCWLLARSGMPTSSCFKLMMAQGRKDQESVGRRRYLHRLGAELVTGKPTVTYRNTQMERGKLWEPDAMAAYISKTGATVDHVALVRNDTIMCGASPDGLIGNDGAVEIKTMEQELMFGFLTAPGVPSEHMAQLQGLLWVTGRAWVDLVIYSPGFDLWVERVGRDDRYIEEMNRYRLAFQQELADAIFFVTDETINTWRKRHDQRIAERITEEGGGNEEDENHSR